MTNPTDKKCCDLCEKARETGEPYDWALYCGDSNCPCHQEPQKEAHLNECPMNETFGDKDKPCTCPTLPSISWEEEFDREFEISFVNNEQEATTLFLNTSPDELKSFINKLLERERERVKVENAHSLGREEAIREVREKADKLKPVLWNDDPNRHLENVAKYNVLSELLQELEK